MSAWERDPSKGLTVSPKGESMAESENKGRLPAGSGESPHFFRVHTDGPIRRHPAWLHYSLAVSMTAAALVIYLLCGPAFDSQPAPIIFLIPILISAYLGGLGPGLFCTLLGVLCADYFLTPPYHSFRIIHAVDFVRLASVLVIGVLVSFMFESLHRAGGASRLKSKSSNWLSLERKVRLTFAFGAVCLILVAGISYRAVESLRSNEEWVDHTHQVLILLNQLLSTITDAETGERGYAITGNERYLEPYDAAMEKLAARQREIRELTQDNAGQQRNLDALDRLLAERVSILRGQIELRRKQGFEAAQAAMATDAGKNVHDRIRALIEEMVSGETALLKERSTRADRSSLAARVVILGGSLIALLVVMAALFLISVDFTGKGRAEAELVEAQATLEHRVVARTQELGAANEQLRKSEEQLRLMISGVKDYAIFMLDPEGHVATWNPGGQRLKGWAAEEIVGEHFSRFYTDEEIADKLPQRELEIAKTEGRFEGEGWRIRKDGSRFWASVVITPVLGEDGLLVGFSKVTRDTSERRRIEQAMKEEEARLAAVIGSAMDAVITVDENQRITLFNPAAEQMFGYSTELMLGRPLDRLVPERYRATHASHIRKFAETNVSRRKMGALIPIYGLRSNGEEFPIEASISQASIAGQVILSVILRDVSERNRTDEVLRQHASLLDVAPVLVRDMEDRIVFWSSGLAKLYNFSREEAEGRISHELLKTIFPEPLKEIQQTLDSAGIWEGELLHRDRDGNQVVVNSQWVLDRDSQGKPVRILELNADITAKKHAEALHLRSQKLESLGTLSGGIAHDFNNILLAITGNTKLAIADLPSDHPVQQSLAEIARAGSRATDLVRRILTFSRPGEMKRQVCSLQFVVEEALKLVRATLPATIEFRTAFAPNLANVLADASQIHQIVVNLATNAAHAIGDRSDGLIEVRVDNAELTADDSRPSLNLREGSYVRVFVSDNGCGMDRATQDRIFDPFFTTKGPGEGTGLGLAVVHGIMKNHDGGIAVYSEPGRGTAFQLFFPAAGPAGATVQKVTAPVERERTERVLYVDDEEPLVVLITRMLGRLGYKVTGETNPVHAVELFRASPKSFDVVVTDLAMPQLSGFDMASQLLAIRPDVPIVMTSGFVRPEDQKRAQAMGIRELILKPDTIDQLGRALDGIFQHELC
jgi:PAS domain S-box-containing protein